MAPTPLLKDPRKRAARLRALIKRVEAGEHVQNRDINMLLTDTEREQFKRDLANLGDISAVNSNVQYPSDLDSYFKLIGQADRTYSEYHRNRNNKTQRKRPMKSHVAIAEGIYDRAQERLGELLGCADPVIKQAMIYWLDRPLNYTHGQIDFGLDPSCVPRKRGSRSQYAQKSDTGVLNKHEQKRRIKIDAMMAARLAMIAPKLAKRSANATTQPDLTKLRALIALRHS